MTGRPNRGTGIPSDPTRQHAQGTDRRHPPFAEGNTAHLVHGARSERAIEAMAEHVHDEIREVAPWLAEPQFAPSVHRYLRAAAREQLLDRFIQETCDTKGPAKVPARAWEQATAATRLAASLAADLGLTPTGHARLKQLAGSARVTEITLGELQAQGREVRLAAEARMAAPALDPDDQEDA